MHSLKARSFPTAYFDYLNSYDDLIGLCEIYYLFDWLRNLKLFWKKMVTVREAGSCLVKYTGINEKLRWKLVTFLIIKYFQGRSKIYSVSRSLNKMTKRKTSEIFFGPPGIKLNESDGEKEKLKKKENVHKVWYNFPSELATESGSSLNRRRHWLHHTESKNVFGSNFHLRPRIMLFLASCS